MPTDKLVFVCKLEGGKWILGVATNEQHALTTIGSWYVHKQHQWLRDYPLQEIVEKRTWYDDIPATQHLEQVAVEYMKRYGAERVRFGNTDTLPEQFYTMYPDPNPNIKYT